jgi:hypothetical protein
MDSAWPYLTITGSPSVIADLAKRHMDKIDTRRET